MKGRKREKEEREKRERVKREQGGRTFYSFTPFRRVSPSYVCLAERKRKKREGMREGERVTIFLSFSTAGNNPCGIMRASFNVD